MGSAKRDGTVWPGAEKAGEGGWSGVGFYQHAHISEGRVKRRWADFSQGQDKRQWAQTEAWDIPSEH